MKHIVNKENIKVVQEGRYVVMATKLDPITFLHNNNKPFAVNLQGLGNTGTGASGQPWLVTLTNTRTSYIFLKNENVAPSYIAERLNFYDTQDATLVSNLIQELLRSL